MASLAEIRAKLKAQETAGQGTNKPSDNSIYPFWNLEDNTESTIRFLEDGDSNNTFFWVERQMIKLPFAGVKNDPASKPVMVQVPCMEMYGDPCPVLTEVRPWFKDPSLEEMGRKYWKKRSYVFQGFVTDDGLKEEESPENPIRRFIIGPQLFNIIKGALMDPEMDDLPTDAVNGVDFRIVKTKKGSFADYSTSKWSRKTRPLSDDEQAAIKEHGLFDLKEFLPKKPGEVELQIIKEMFEASVDGEAYDLDRWGQYYRPSGMSAPATSAAPVVKSAPKAEPKAEDDDDDVPFEVDEKPTKTAAAEPAGESSNRADDILAMIRNRQK